MAKQNDIKISPILFKVIVGITLISLTANIYFVFNIYITNNDTIIRGNTAPINGVGNNSPNSNAGPNSINNSPNSGNK